VKIDYTAAVMNAEEARPQFKNFKITVVSVNGHISIRRELFPRP
jgi:hypothetical protein